MKAYCRLILCLLATAGAAGTVRADLSFADEPEDRPSFRALPLFTHRAVQPWIPEHRDASQSGRKPGRGPGSVDSSRGSSSGQADTGRAGAPVRSTPLGMVQALHIDGWDPFHADRDFSARRPPARDNIQVSHASQAFAETAGTFVPGSRARERILAGGGVSYRKQTIIRSTSGLFDRPEVGGGASTAMASGGTGGRPGFRAARAASGQSLIFPRRRRGMLVPKRDGWRRKRIGGAARRGFKLPRDAGAVSSGVFRPAGSSDGEGTEQGFVLVAFAWIALPTGMAAFLAWIWLGGASKVRYLRAPAFNPVSRHRRRI